ncbi:pilus assembly protein PilP [Saccharospirillum sp. HFRX-1]|uniref:pilus assembly protein PilP n=1 Tax=unclassified Saccharospirillum TaxID=2633430 RepID=UPI003711E651
MTDLQALVAETDAPASAKLTAAESGKAGRKIQYAAQDKRSPFQNPLTSTPRPQVLQPSAVTSLEPVGPSDQAKPAAMKLDELIMVGTLSGIQSASIQALFRDGDGHIHRLSVGDVIGANSARIVAVSETRVELLEKVPQEDGGWIVQPRTFLLSQQKPSDF